MSISRVVIGFLTFVSACGPNSTNAGGPGGAEADAGSDATPPPPAATAIVYGHTQDQKLFSLDPDTLALNEIGNMGVTLIDIAVNKEGEIFGASNNKIFRVDKNTAALTELSDVGLALNGLTFVPDPQNSEAEILVGAGGGNGEIWQINTTDGSSTIVGDYGGNYTSSGDLFFVDGIGILATLNGTGGDILAQINPTTYAATEIGNTGVPGIYGLAFWGDTVYGFSSGSGILSIDPDTAAATPISTAGNQIWYGAGVTTIATVIID